VSRLSLEPTPESSARIEDLGYALSITISLPRNQGNSSAAAFLGVWLCGWAVGEVLAGWTLLRMVMDPKHAMAPGTSAGLTAVFIGVWLVGWTFGGLAAISALLTQLVGSERVTVGPEGLVLRRLPLGRSRRFALAEVANLRYDPTASVGRVLGGMAPRGSGVIAFDHPGGTQRFGLGLDEGEAKRIIRTIRDRFGASMGEQRPQSEEDPQEEGSDEYPESLDAPPPGATIHP
jgi:hypothetical protein